MLKWISVMWCKAMHPQPMWPIHGQYVCPTCMRRYSVPWEGAQIAEQRTTAAVRPARSGRPLRPVTEARTPVSF
jgi:hypothetical protein